MSEKPPNQYDVEFPERGLEQEKWDVKNKEKPKEETQEDKKTPTEKPLKNSAVFSPEKEVRNILKSPKKVQRQKLEDFKEKFASQNERLGVFYEEMVSAIRANPDDHAGNFRRIEEQSIAMGLSPSQVEVAVDAFNKYAQKHNEVSSIRKKYPDDAALFKAIFKKSPNGEIEILEGPMTLYIKCHDEMDYALIHSDAPLQDRDVNQHDIDSARMSLGVAKNIVPMPELTGTVLAENTSRVQFLNDLGDKRKIIESDSIRAHEEQHAIKKLFGDEYFRMGAYYIIESASNDKKAEEALIKTFRYYREEIAEHRVKDEILAYFKQETNPYDIYGILSTPLSKGGIYDYWASYKAKDNFPEAWKKNIQKKNIEKLIDDAEWKVFIDEYHKIIRDGIRNVYFLKSKGYSDEQVIGMLINEPLSKWPKVIGRLVAGKRIAKARES